MIFQLFRYLLCLLATLSLSMAHGNEDSFNVGLLKADKEFRSHYVSREEGEAAIQEANFTSSPERLAESITAVIGESIEEVLQNPVQCDLTLAKAFSTNLKRRGFKSTFEAQQRMLKIVRHFNLIDDILYDILLRNLSIRNTISHKIKNPEQPPKAVFYGRPTIEKTQDILGKVGDRWPDGVSACPTIALGRLLGSVAKEFDRTKFSSVNRKLKQITKIAYDKKMINYTNYVRISTLAEFEVGRNNVLLSRYLDNLVYAKNKLSDTLGYIRGERDDSMVETEETEGAVEFTSKLIERREKLTQRTRLYKKYDSTQIMLLADILVKTSQRMNARKSHIEIFYRDTIDPDETYVISPMEQYRMALRMLRKEMRNVTMMDTFAGKSPSYDEIITAAFETGVFTFNELDFVISYEEFWNPESSKFKKVIRFAFDIAGTMSLYLPPPYNVIGAIGLVFTESKILRHKAEVNSEHNSNSIF